MLTVNQKYNDSLSFPRKRESRIKKTGFRVKPGKEKAMHLLSKTGVAGVPGEAFFHGADGGNLIRLCFAKRDDELEEAVRRIGQLA